LENRRVSLTQFHFYHQASAYKMEVSSV